MQVPFLVSELNASLPKKYWRLNESIGTLVCQTGRERESTEHHKFVDMQC
jgi:hypothetical protein